jgi:hypothetical protein
LWPPRLQLGGGLGKQGRRASLCTFLGRAQHRRSVRWRHLELVAELQAPRGRRRAAAGQAQQSCRPRSRRRALADLRCEEATASSRRTSTALRIGGGIDDLLTLLRRKRQDGGRAKARAGSPAFRKTQPGWRRARDASEKSRPSRCLSAFCDERPVGYGRPRLEILDGALRSLPARHTFSPSPTKNVGG